MASHQYRGRLAPTPTGYLHLGHAHTFAIAHARARSRRGILVLRNEDLDRQRCKPEFVEAMLEDLKWYGLDWDEGPDVGGPHAPYQQSDRRDCYLSAWRKLKAMDYLYPCTRSRKEVQESVAAPQEGDQETIFPTEWRPKTGLLMEHAEPQGFNWRFRVPDGEKISFNDGRLGSCSYVAGSDFGDFLVWRRDDTPSYELAVVIDDDAMDITEVVRGEDLLLSTARQILIYKALNRPIPAFYHTALVRDSKGDRLAKRHDSQSLRELRASGMTAEQLRSAEGEAYCV